MHAGAGKDALLGVSGRSAQRWAWPASHAPARRWRSARLQAVGPGEGERAGAWPRSAFAQEGRAMFLRRGAACDWRGAAAQPAMTNAAKLRWCARKPGSPRWTAEPCKSNGLMVALPVRGGRRCRNLPGAAEQRHGCRDLRCGTPPSTAHASQLPRLRRCQKRPRLRSSEQRRPQAASTATAGGGCSRAWRAQARCPSFRDSCTIKIHAGVIIAVI